ncbi:MAG: alpha/beta hydrolase [Pseudomonadota bacterium]|nr:alpha/beta hydrolase [Pseudomonadota bacterium]
MTNDPPSCLTPQMATLLQRMRRAGRPPLHTLTPSAARAAYNVAAEVLDLPRVPLLRVEDFHLPAGDGSVLAARLYAAATEPRPALLYLHGGGFMIGGLETHDSLCRQLALRSGWTVIALDYRLAPEHRFPAAFDDVWSALQALAADPVRYGIAARPMAIGGDSAGGTLAASTALQARNHALPLALQLLITPGTAARADSASHRRFASGFLLEAPAIEWFFDHFISAEQRNDWRFAPLHADADGVAPACVILAECDPLVDEGLAYADHLRAAGVPVKLELTRGVTHDFIKLGRVLREASHALDFAAAALREVHAP